MYHISRLSQSPFHFLPYVLSHLYHGWSSGLSASPPRLLRATDKWAVVLWNWLYSCTSTREARRVEAGILGTRDAMDERVNEWRKQNVSTDKSLCWALSVFRSAIYLCKRTMQNKTRLELADYEAVSAGPFLQPIASWYWSVCQAWGRKTQPLKGRGCVGLFIIKDVIYSSDLQNLS